MAKNPAPSADNSSGAPLWISHALVGVSGICLGIIGTYLALKPQLARPAAPLTQAQVESVTGAGSSGGSALPPAGLTAGMAPAQADRTLGNFYYDQSNWSQAIRYYESAIKQGSDDADIRTDLGNAYQFAGQPTEALAQYQKAQQLNPQHEFSLFNMGGLYLNGLHSPTKAVEVWNAYLTRFPNGRNAAAARQLIAQAGGGTVAAPGAAQMPATASAPSASGPDATEARLLKLVTPAKPDKP
jgi:tetratricopeptide (TPR) repeat protein